MLLKFKFKNYYCFPEWEEVDLQNYNVSHQISLASNICSIYGERSTGKSAITKLMKLVVDYIRGAIGYDSEFSPSDKNNIVSSHFNPSSSNFSTNDEDDESYANVNEFKSFNKKNVESDNTFVEMYLTDGVYTFKYELCFNELYPEYEALSYSVIEENIDDNESWIWLYKKRNISYDVIQQKSSIIFDVEVNEPELNITTPITFVNLNQKNSLLYYLKSSFRCKIVNSFFQIINSFVFFDETRNLSSFKEYEIDKRFLIESKSIFLSFFDELNINIKDFSISDFSSKYNNFYLSIAKENNLNQIFWINSRFESTSTLRFFHIVYFICKALKTNTILIIDEFDKYFSTNEIVYFMSWISEALDHEKENLKSQVILNISKNVINDLISVSKANIEITNDSISSTIKRVS